MELYLLKNFRDATRFAILPTPLIFSGLRSSSVFFQNIHTVGLKHVLTSWVRFLNSGELYVLNDPTWPQVVPEPLDLLLPALALVESRAPCDDTEIVALRSGLLPKIVISQ